MPKGRWYEWAEAGEKDLPSPEEMDVAGDPRVRPPTPPVSSVLNLLCTFGCRNGLHDSERTEGA